MLPNEKASKYMLIQQPLSLLYFQVYIFFCYIVKHFSSIASHHYIRYRDISFWLILSCGGWNEMANVMECASKFYPSHWAIDRFCCWHIVFLCHILTLFLQRASMLNYISNCIHVLNGYFTHLTDLYTLWRLCAPAYTL